MFNSDLALLACGNYSDYGDIKDAFANLANKITQVEDRLMRLPTESDDDISMLGPFLGRTLLESVCVALVGRIDPFRLLIVQTSQKCSTYSVEKRSNSAIVWDGDIFEKGSSQLNHGWDPEIKLKEITRGLLGDFYGELFWQPAYKKLLDNTNDYPDEELLAHYRRTITTPRNFTPYIRQRASRLYSALSKGIHSELVVNTEIVLDKATVLDRIGDTLELCAIMSLVSHFIDTSICRIDYDQALTIYIRANQRSVHYGD